MRVEEMCMMGSYDRLNVLKIAFSEGMASGFVALGLGSG